MITVENGQILGDYDKGVLINALVESANMWDQTAEEIKKSQVTGLAKQSIESLERHAVTARTIALNIQTCKYVLLDQGETGG